MVAPVIMLRHHPLVSQNAARWLEGGQDIRDRMERSASVTTGGRASIATVRLYCDVTIRTLTWSLAVCESDDACHDFPLSPLRAALPGDIEVPIANMTCFKGGQPVHRPHQMCDVTST